MTHPCLCIIQARYHSTRLEGKMLLKLGDETLIHRAWRLACEAFGADNCVIAYPMGDENTPLADEVRRIGANWDCTFPGVDADVLGRFYHVSHKLRWHPDSVIVRYTPDDPFKTVEGLRRVANGERLPVEIGGEAFTLAMLDAAHGDTFYPGDLEHITHALFPGSPPPPAPSDDVWTVDTPEDYARAIARYERDAKSIEESYQMARAFYRDSAEAFRRYGESGAFSDPLAALRAIQESA